MTRISSYDFLSCNKCGQIHLKANYASISSSIPTDALIKGSDIRTCFKCGDKKPFNNFVYIKSEQKPARVNNDFYFYSIKLLFCKILKLKLPEKDFRQIYPLI
jgi:hypothetical protein